MKKLIGVIVVVVALAACGKKGDDAKGSAGGGGATPACAAAAGKAVASLPPGGDPGVRTKLQDIYSKRCTEDKWSAEIIKCYESAAGMVGLQACRAKLPPEQGQRLLAEIMAAMAAASGAGARPPMGHPGGAGAPPAGAPPAGAPPAGAPPAGAPPAADGSAQ